MSTHRDALVLQLRPTIPSIDLTKSLSPSESFQNNTLRPILKYQDVLIRILFEANSKSPILKTLDVADQRHRINKILETDTLLRNQLIGLILGLMSQDEFKDYLEMESEMKKRIKTMLVERLIIK